jgi:glycosyltransferase involved in cell wall biosynthesis
MLIEAFAGFSADKPDALLYLHTDPDDLGWDVIDLLKRHGVHDKTCISATASIRRGVDSSKLNEVYNYFDVMALPTAGEGFGLPILEAMAAGVPVMATAYSSCVELVADRGCLIRVKDFITAGRHNVEYAVPDVDDIVLNMDRLYAEPKLRQRYGDLGRAFALTLDWARVVLEWQVLLASLRGQS